MLLSIIELGFQGGIFVLRNTYYLGRYMVFGKEKTSQERLEEKLQMQIDAERQKVAEIQSEVDELKLERRTVHNIGYGSPDTSMIKIKRRDSI